VRRWGFDPFEEFGRLSSMFGDGQDGFGVRLDVREDAGHYFVDVDLPGFTKENLDVTLQEGVLTISGERKREEKKEGESYHYIERRTGRFARSVRLPDGVKSDTVDASLKNGVLTITVDKAEEVKPRKIDVKG
jgi:HSP20 family protein